MKTESKQLTGEELRVRVAELCGTDNRWTLIKRGYYFRHAAKGYTAQINEAWVITEEEAREWCDDEVGARRLPSPDYLNDLNVMAEVERTLSDEDFAEYYRRLYILTRPDDVSTMAGIALHTRNFISATAEQRACAFVMVKEAQP